ncbi:hypothetical protein [Thiomonas sp.]
MHAANNLWQSSQEQQTQVSEFVAAIRPELDVESAPPRPLHQTKFQRLCGVIRLVRAYLRELKAARGRNPLERMQASHERMRAQLQLRHGNAALLAMQRMSRLPRR